MLSPMIHRFTTTTTKLVSKPLLTPIASVDLPTKFSTLPLQSLTSSINPSTIKQQINIFTGNTNSISNHNHIMQRVWEKRKQRLFKATNTILSKFQNTNIKFETVEIYIRKAGSFDDTNDNEVHIALRGIAHTVIVLKNKNELYLLDRVVEGIRLTQLTINKQNKIEKCNKFKPDEMVKLSTFNNINLSSKLIAEWINKESETQYNVFRNNCVQFSLYFYQQFLYGLKFKQISNHLKSCS